MLPQIVVLVCVIVISYVRFYGRYIKYSFNFKQLHLFFGDKHQWTDLLLPQRLLKAHEENFAPLIQFHVQCETFHDSLLSYKINKSQ